MSSDSTQTEAATSPAWSIGLLLGVLVAPTALGNTSPSVALPAIADHFAISLASTSWVLAAFAIATGIGVAVFGRVSDSYGLKRCLTVGSVLLLMGSALAVLAPTFPMLIVGRTLQGFGGGALPIVAFSAVTLSYGGLQRTATMGVVVAVISVAAGGGPLVGGALENFGGWRAVLALPGLSVLVVPFVYGVLTESTPSRRSIDLFGAGAVAVGVTGFVVALQAPAAGFSLIWVGIGLAAAIGGATLATLRSRSYADGFVPRAIVDSARFRLCCAVGFTVFAANLVTLICTSLLFRNRFELTQLESGALLGVGAFFGVGAATQASRWMSRVGFGKLNVLMALTCAAGMMISAVGAKSIPLLVVGWSLVLIGFAVAQVVLLDAVPLTVAKSWQSSAQGLFNLTFVVGAGFGAAMAGALAETWSPAAALATLAALPVVGAVIATRLPATEPEA